MRSLVVSEDNLKKIFSLGPKNKLYQIVECQESIVIPESQKVTDQTDRANILWEQYKANLHKKKCGLHFSPVVHDMFLKNKDALFSMFGDSLYLLDISEQEAETISRDYGVCCISSNDPNPPYLTEEGWDLNANDITKEKSWTSFYQGVNRNCSSAIIIDRFLFCKEWNKGNECPDETIETCQYNLQEIMDNILPFDIKDNKFVLTIVFTHQEAIKCEKKDENGEVVRDSNNRIVYEKYTFKELVEMIEQVRKNIYRPYSFDIEAISIGKKCPYYNDTHDRYVITNFHITNATQKLVAFNEQKEMLHKQMIYFNYIYSKGLTGRSSLPICMKENMLDSIKKLISSSNERNLFYALNGTIVAHSAICVKNKLLK